MATAKLVKAKPVTPPPTIVLTLTKEEAETIYCMCGNCVGSISNSPRKHTHNIYDALEALDIDDGECRTRDGNNTIEFLDYHDFSKVNTGKKT